MPLGLNPEEWLRRTTDPDEWRTSAHGPVRIQLDDEQREQVKRHLWSVGVPVDPFKTPELPLVFRTNKFAGLALYAAIKEVTKGLYRIWPTSAEWARQIGASW